MLNKAFLKKQKEVWKNISQVCYILLTDQILLFDCLNFLRLGQYIVFAVQSVTT